MRCLFCHRNGGGGGHSVSPLRSKDRSCPTLFCEVMGVIPPVSSGSFLSLLGQGGGLSQSPLVPSSDLKVRVGCHYLSRYGVWSLPLSSSHFLNSKMGVDHYGPSLCLSHSLSIRRKTFRCKDSLIPDRADKRHQYCLVDSNPLNISFFQISRVPRLPTLQVSVPGPKTTLENTT